MVFQAYALFPNLTVAQNVAFGLAHRRARRGPRATRRVAEMLAIIDLPDLGARYPFQLSGGQQQRVALARALAPRPEAPAPRRAALGARRQDPRLAPRGDPRHPEEARHHHHLRHPRPGRGPVDVRPDRGDERRASPSRSATPSPSTTAPRRAFVASFVGTLNAPPRPRHRPRHRRPRPSTASRVTLGRPLAAAAGATVGFALRPEALSPRPSPAATSLCGQRRGRDLPRLGRAACRSRIGGQRLALDTFNTAAFRPPAVGDTVDHRLRPPPTPSSPEPVHSPRRLAL